MQAPLLTQGSQAHGGWPPHARPPSTALPFVQALPFPVHPSCFPHTLACSRLPTLQVCPLSQLEPECLMAVVRHLAEPPLAPWLFKQPWGKVTGPDMDAIYGTSVDDHWPPLEW